MDNNATMLPNYNSSIAPGATGIYAAENTNNGIQMKLTFTTTQGATVMLDNDVHKTDRNTYAYEITNSKNLTFVGNVGVGGGQQANAIALLGDCSSENTCNGAPGVSGQISDGG